VASSSEQGGPGRDGRTKAKPGNGWAALGGFLAACFAAAGLGGWIAAGAIPGWYATLEKPRFTPPNWVFGPVWTLLYLLMAVAAWLVWREPESGWRTKGLRLFWAQLALNVCWTAIFFGFHRVGLAALEIVLLWMAILATAYRFFRLRRAAGWLLVPYALWVAYAALLNWAIVRLSY
jgi:benzodiazapine receptor